jgi:hypothetical protein
MKSADEGCSMKVQLGKTRALVLAVGAGLITAFADFVQTRFGDTAARYAC